MEKLEEKLKVKTAEVCQMGMELSKKRKETAKKLEKRITDELSGLNMPGVRFAVEFAGIQSEEGFDKNGCDDIRFVMSANAGEAMGRISKIASGGELARIMLAMKNVLAENDEVCTMVFDEIDTGVSGVAAQRVGEKLSDLSSAKQVLCVTHLPQIAAMADRHFSISKSQIDGRTYTTITPLDDMGRQCEIARLASGENITELGLESAREQLLNAQKYKEHRKDDEWRD